MPPCRQAAWRPGIIRARSVTEYLTGPGGREGVWPDRSPPGRSIVPSIRAVAIGLVIVVLAACSPAAGAPPNDHAHDPADRRRRRQSDHCTSIADGDHATEPGRAPTDRESGRGQRGIRDPGAHRARQRGDRRGPEERRGLSRPRCRPPPAGPRDGRPIAVPAGGRGIRRRAPAGPGRPARPRRDRHAPARQAPVRRGAEDRQGRPGRGARTARPRSASSSTPRSSSVATTTPR